MEVAVTDRMVGLRDSKDRDAGQLWFDRAAFASFLSAAQRGEFDRN